MKFLRTDGRQMFHMLGRQMRIVPEEFAVINRPGRRPNNWNAAEDVFQNRRHELIVRNDVVLR